MQRRLQETDSPGDVRQALEFALEVSAAVECMKAGAFDYMVKAVEESRLVSGVRRAIEIRKLS